MNNDFVDYDHVVILHHGRRDSVRLGYASSIHEKEQDIEKNLFSEEKLNDDETWEFYFSDEEILDKRWDKKDKLI